MADFMLLILLVIAAIHIHRLEKETTKLWDLLERTDTLLEAYSESEGEEKGQGDGDGQG